MDLTCRTLIANSATISCYAADIRLSECYRTNIRKEKPAYLINVFFEKITIFLFWPLLL